jgi:hypothetical protein
MKKEFTNQDVVYYSPINNAYKIFKDLSITNKEKQK